MKTFSLYRKHFIKKNKSEVFAFFQNAENLELLTPKNLKFKILSNTPIQMRTGTVIDYQIKIFGIPLQWQTLIEDYDPQNRFVDSQTKGPYALWRHTHTFTEDGQGTMMEDEVVYALPLGWLGRVAHVLWVKAELNRIFDYRNQMIDQIFKS